MAINTQLSQSTVEAEAAALAALFSSGYLRIFEGAQPAGADTAAPGVKMLAELRFGSVAFASVTDGIMVANTIAPVVAGNTGTASWFRTFQSDGTTPILDGSVGTSDANLVLGSVSISEGLIVNVSSFIHTIAKAYTGI